MSRRRLVPIVLALAVAAVVVVGLLQAGGKSTSGDEPAVPSLAEARRMLAGAPAPLAGLHAQANTVIPGSEKIIKARLRALRGYPVVMNKWASWCAPCRHEFPVFQRVSAALGKQVAFVGLDAADNRQDAEKFLARRPLSYPSFEDGDARAALRLGAGTKYPTTVFFDRSGKMVYAHQGPYDDDAALEKDIRRWVLDAA